MKSIIAVLAVALVLPAGALARTDQPSTDLRAPDQQARSEMPSRLPAVGTDVAAPDQQAPTSGPITGTHFPVPAQEPASTPPRVVTVSSPAAASFDWADAAIGAGAAALLVSISLGGAVTLRRRRRVTAFTG